MSKFQGKVRQALFQLLLPVSHGVGDLNYCCGCDSRRSRGRRDPTRVLPALPIGCASRNHTRASSDLGNFSHLFPARSNHLNPTPPRKGVSSATSQMPRGMQGTPVPLGEIGKGLFLPFIVAPSPSCQVCGLFTVPIKCTLRPGRRCSTPSPHLVASILPPSIKQLVSRGRGGKSQQHVWFAVFVGTLQLQRFPSGSQGARGRGQ